MTKDNLIEIIGRIVQYEVNKAVKATRKEMQAEISKAVNNLKVQLLQEMKRGNQPTNNNTTIAIKSTDPIGKIHSEFRKSYQSTQRQTPTYSTSPILNELLTKTQPLQGDELADVGAISVLDNIGKIGGKNPMADILNRDYTALVKKMEPPQKAKLQQPIVNQSLQREEFRNSIMSKMQMNEGTVDLGEDLSWMKDLD
jgi:hypothetical protein